jgi:hypothetical protein
MKFVSLGFSKYCLHFENFAKCYEIFVKHYGFLRKFLFHEKLVKYFTDVRENEISRNSAFSRFRDNEDVIFVSTLHGTPYTPAKDSSLQVPHRKMKIPCKVFYMACIAWRSPPAAIDCPLGFSCNFIILSDC